ncbi:FUSC family protein [Aeromicrobium wangtongii]|uniref:FUSC family protein n=1 Tax=Aeromicrobium wangtongii TaxID=2969247 RepID=UPI0020178B56|nr:FUSC family protein [Aeromicrobium wangtongii]MCL3818099.1 FUSC family protein [Aeromicrobium wangtongii]
MSPSRDVPLWRIRLPRSELTWSDRLRMLRKRWRLLLRLGGATAAAYFVSTHLLGHAQAFFAPISAVIVIIAGAGLRVRTLFELVLGVALGVLVGELLILAIGRGTWQIALVVVLTVIACTLLGIKGLAMTQAANSSVLLAAVIPAANAGNPAVTRFADALIGGCAGLAMILLVPRNAVRDIDIEVQSLLRRLGGVLGQIAEAMRQQDNDLAEQALAEARAMQPGLQALESTAASVSEITRMSPMRWKQREHVGMYVGAIRDFDNAIRDARVLARRTAAMLRHHEQAPAGMDLAVESLSKAVGIFADDLSERDDFEQARRQLVDAARIAVMALPGAMTMNTAAIAAQVRSLAADLLYASGATRDEIDERLDFD